VNYGFFFSYFLYQRILIEQKGFLVVFPYLRIMYFDQIHPLYYTTLRSLLGPSCGATLWYFNYKLLVFEHPLNIFQLPDL
jgi:hypothetical protein